MSNSQEKQLQAAYVLQASGIGMSYIIIILEANVHPSLVCVGFCPLMAIFIGGQMSGWAHVHTPPCLFHCICTL